MTATTSYVHSDDGCRLWTVMSGEGPPVIFCHGGPGLWDMLRPVAAMVDDLARVVRWDQRGGGRSSPVGPYTVARFVEDMETVRRHFGWRSWIVGGHSWGATLALTYALAHPDRTRAIIYVSGTGIGDAWREAYHRERLRRLEAAGVAGRWLELSSRARSDDEERELDVLTWTTDYVDMEFGRPRSQAMLADGFLPNLECNAALSAETKGWREDDLAQRCATLDMPALIVHGSGDPRPAWAIDSLAAALPHAQKVVIEEAGHLPWEEAPDPFQHAVREFIAPLV